MTNPQEEKLVEWQKIFLDMGTELLGDDLSVMIPVVSNILAHQRQELVEKIKELGHQQDDDTIWCEMDKLLSLLTKDQI